MVADWLLLECPKSGIPRSLFRESEYEVCVSKDDCKSCYLYEVCRNLAGNKPVWNLPEAYKVRQTDNKEINKGIEYYYQLQEAVVEAAKEKMKSTKEITDTLFEKYHIKVSGSLVFKYATFGLISPEENFRRVCKGKVGMRTYWSDKTTGKVYVIIQLTRKEGFKLRELTKFNEMIYREPLQHLQLSNISDRGKFYAVAAFFAAAEAELDFNQYNFSNNLVYSTNVNLDEKSLTVKLNDIETITRLTKDTGDFEWKPINVVTFKNDSVTVT